MKKIAVLIFVCVACAGSVRANYNDGYDNGYRFGYEIVEMMVANHPEWGVSLSVNPWNSWADELWNLGLGLPTYISSSQVSSTYQYDFIGSYSAFRAAEVAILSLWQTGGFDWLYSRSTLSDWDHGMWDGFSIGTYQRMWDFQ